MKAYTLKQFSLTAIRLVIICGIVILISGATPATVKESQADKKEQPVELHNLSNDELLKQAQQLFDEGYARFLAQLRGLHRMKQLFRQAQQKTNALDIPEEEIEITDDEADSLKVAEIKRERAQKRVVALKIRLDLIKNEKARLEQQIKQIETALTAAANHKAAIEKLKLFQLEIALRVADGTLLHESIPAILNTQRINILNTERMENLAQYTNVQKTKLKSDAEMAQTNLKSIVERIEESQKAITEAEARYASAQEKYTQELKWKNLEKKIAGTQPKDLLSLLPKLIEERVWLKGSYKLSIRQYKNSLAKVDHIQRELEQMKPPKVAKMLESQANGEAVDEKVAKEVVQKMADYYTKRM